MLLRNHLHYRGICSAIHVLRSFEYFIDKILLPHYFLMLLRLVALFVLKQKINKIKEVCILPCVFVMLKTKTTFKQWITTAIVYCANESNTTLHVITHPRRPRDSQSGQEKRREESFQAQACKVVVLPCQGIAFLTFSSPPHLKLPIIYDTLWTVRNTILSVQIELLLLIASETFFYSSLVPSFLVGK